MFVTILYQNPCNSEVFYGDFSLYPWLAEIDKCHFVVYLMISVFCLSYLPDVEICIPCRLCDQVECRWCHQPLQPWSRSRSRPLTSKPKSCPLLPPHSHRGYQFPPRWQHCLHHRHPVPCNPYLRIEGLPVTSVGQLEVQPSEPRGCCL